MTLLLIFCAVMSVGCWLYSAYHLGKAAAYKEVARMVRDDPWYPHHHEHDHG